MKNIFKFLKKGKIANPPWDYDFLVNLEKSEYPRYLSKLFKIRTEEELPLLKEWNFKKWTSINPCGQKLWNYIIDKNRCKTFNQKIQWIKLYGITPLMRDCTDKVKVRDFVREKIGDEYLKPVLQICNSFDEIDWDKLSNSFVIKCNHGCKWHYIIKNKEEYLKNKRLVEITRRNITGWLEQDYSLLNGFELNYRGIEPKILIEPLLRDSINKDSQTINVYCFNGYPEIIIKFYGNGAMSIFNKKLKHEENIFNFLEKNIITNIDDLVNQSFDLSEKLSKDFLFVRVDWIIYRNKLYFEELTFTPYSGFNPFIDKERNLELGKLIKIERL